MATAGEEKPGFLDRASRATRGKRMTKLLHEEIDEDEQFWNQDALKEEENDDSYEEEGEVADEFDSDFDDDESEPDDEAENELDERVKRKKLTFPGKQATKKRNQKKAVSKLERLTEDENPPQTEEPNEPEQQEVPDEAEGERIVRKSTRTAVIVRQAEREAIRAALQATMKPIKRKKEGEEKRMTQEEMLLEAAQTEIRNLRNLERVLAREEEVKKRAVIHKEVYTGPQMRYCSKDGETEEASPHMAGPHIEAARTPPYDEQQVASALCDMRDLIPLGAADITEPHAISTPASSRPRDESLEMVVAFSASQEIVSSEMMKQEVAPVQSDDFLEHGVEWPDGPQSAPLVGAEVVHETFVGIIWATLQLVTPPSIEIVRDVLRRNTQAYHVMGLPKEPWMTTMDDIWGEVRRLHETTWKAHCSEIQQLEIEVSALIGEAQEADSQVDIMRSRRSVLVAEQAEKVSTTFKLREVAQVMMDKAQALMTAAESSFEAIQEIEARERTLSQRCSDLKTGIVIKQARIEELKGKKPRHL